MSIDREGSAAQKIRQMFLGVVASTLKSTFHPDVSIVNRPAIRSVTATVSSAGGTSSYVISKVTSSVVTPPACASAMIVPVGGSVVFGGSVTSKVTSSESPGSSVRYSFR